jgi:hypothetical protein
VGSLRVYLSVCALIVARLIFNFSMFYLQVCLLVFGVIFGWIYVVCPKRFFQITFHDYHDRGNGVMAGMMPPPNGIDA